jgi:hypothetical protein
MRIAEFVSHAISEVKRAGVDDFWLTMKIFVDPNNSQGGLEVLGSWMSEGNSRNNEVEVSVHVMEEEKLVEYTLSNDSIETDQQQSED